MDRTHHKYKNTMAVYAATPCLFFCYRTLKLITMLTSLTAVTSTEPLHGPTIRLLKTKF